ncbi:MAG: hypothetical protein IT208_11845 [Chthonomonadales bacterium]|nr:hypothetical protein [Chthonomonadales bacterium]
MRSVTTAGAAALALALAVAAAAPAAALAPESRKKLIEYGWDVPYPDDVRRNIRLMERKPFDGIVIRLKPSSQVFLHKRHDAAKFAPDLEDLRRTAFGKFTDNLILVWATGDEGWDWFSDADWSAAQHNARLFARAARAGGCRGLCFDPEPYGSNVWKYEAQPRAGKRSFDECRAQVRKRGAQFMRAVQRELRDPLVLTFFHNSLFGGILDISDPESRLKRLSAEGYALLPAFLDGMLDAASPGARIVDGNEIAYYYTASEPFFRAYHTMRQRSLALVDPRNHARYRSQVQAGQAIYMDQLLATRPPEGGYISYFMTPEQRARFLEHNAYYALYTADEYVWCYSERMSWWKNELPPGAEEAIRAARGKVERGEPLGYSIDAIVGEAQRRMREKAQADLTHRTARVPRLPTGVPAPAIDGLLDDPTWRAVAPLEPLLPTRASGAAAADAATTVRVTWDDRCLYLGARCDEPLADRIRTFGRERDDALWEGDTLELFLCPGEAAGPFWQFATNPAGVTFDQRVDGDAYDVGFSPGWLCRAGRDAAGWTAEIAIPWSAVGGTPRVGERRRANVGRERKPREELSTWSQVLSMFLEPTQFGVWEFRN